jgi:hypothetical protein
VSPILIRPVREQLEHDRLIRFLQLKYQKKFEVHINAGEGQAAPVKLAGPAPFFPDLVLLSASKIAGLVEVETGESTNNLEALAQWQHFGRARVPFHLYVPVLMFDAARRFCDAHKVAVTEIWTYRSLYDGFDLVRVFHDPSAVANAPKNSSVVAKLLPPVVNTRVEPERDQKQEMANLVELANRTFKAAAGKSAAAAAAAKAAAAQARAANKAAAKAASAAKAVPPVAPVVAPKVPAAPAKPEKAVPPASKAPAPVAKAVKPAAKASTPKPAAKPVKPAAKAAKPAAKVSKPAPKPIAKKARKPAVAAKPKKAAKKAAGKKR